MSKAINRALIVAISVITILAAYGIVSASTNLSFANTSVVVQAVDDSGEIIMKPTTLSVPAGYASSIDSSYSNDNQFNTDPGSGVSVLDVLFKAHSELYGTAFPSDNLSTFIDGSAGYIEKMFKIDQGAGYSFPGIMYTVNGLQPVTGDPIPWYWERYDMNTEGYTTLAINQAYVDDMDSNGVDTVSFFFINSYEDLYSFDRDAFGTIGAGHVAVNTLQEDNVYSISDPPQIYGYDVFGEGYMAQWAWHPTAVGNAEIYQVANTPTDMGGGVIRYNSSNYVGETDSNGYASIDEDALTGSAPYCLAIKKDGVITKCYSFEE